MFLQSVFSRVAGYEDVNDADTLAHDLAMRLAVGGRAVDTQAASSSQLSRFERETLATPENLKALSDLNGKIIDQIIDRKQRFPLNFFGSIRVLYANTRALDKHA